MTAGASGRGRPLRFLALVALGWIGVRGVLLWPHAASLGEVIEAVVPLPRAAEAAPAGTSRATPSRAAPALAPAAAAASTEPPPLAANPAQVRLALLNLMRFGDPEYLDSPPGTLLVAPGAPAAQQWPSPLPGSRWSASAWLVMRPGTGLGAAPGGGQLGGSQAGVRLAWLADEQRRIALYARLTAPLIGRGRELAVGAEIQPTRLPVRLALEQRIGLDGVRGGPAIGLVGGIDTDVEGFRLEAYAQAGAVGRARIEPYADGAARATRPLAEQGKLRLALGGGAWGAAQRDAARLDLGPSATLALPMGGAQLRLALDWRERVAGDARPGSGPALTIGGDF